MSATQTPEYKKKYYQAHKERWKQKYGSRYAAIKADPVKWARHAGIARAAQLKRTYGLSLLDYNILIQQQNGLCLICRRPLAESKICVDHDHVSGIVRGLLCRQCNIGIGFLQDNPDVLQRGVIYLEEKQKMIDHQLDQVEQHLIELSNMLKFVLSNFKIADPSNPFSQPKSLLDIYYLSLQHPVVEAQIVKET